MALAHFVFHRRHEADREIDEAAQPVVGEIIAVHDIDVVAHQTLRLQNVPPLRRDDEAARVDRPGVARLDVGRNRGHAVALAQHRAARQLAEHWIHGDDTGVAQQDWSHRGHASGLAAR